MVFSSPVFVFLMLPIVFLLNLLVKKKFSNLLLLFFSLAFYAWGEPIYVLLMLGSGLFNYWMSIWMEEKSYYRKVILIVIVVVNILLLGTFKYLDFFIMNINNVFQSQIPLANLPLPIGISFYTFQILSYVIDVYRKQTKVQRNFISLLLYITFFPQLIAGPIVKYRDIASQIKERTMSLSNVYEGLQRFIIGLSKKLLIANSMASVVDTLYALETQNVSTLIAWLGAIAYIFQIYFDFSGYSDMAIGLGRMFGFHFKENFNYPYVATSIQDFWRRWHISLSTWFKLYVYIPLGGNKKGKSRAIFNRITVFFLTGLWHGASWTFVVWGLYHGFFLLLEQTIFKTHKWPKTLARIYMLLVVTIGFVLFRADNFAIALSWIQSMFVYSSSNAIAIISLESIVTSRTLLVLLFAALGSTPWLKFVLDKVQLRQKETILSLFTTILWVICILTLATDTYNPFIYFRF